MKLENLPRDTRAIVFVSHSYPQNARSQNRYAPYCADRPHRFQIDLACDSPVSANPGEASSISEVCMMPRVLVVDDDRLVCKTIELCLEREGFEVTVADSGEAGLHALETSTFDVMLVDIFMPHIRGFE